MRYAQLQIRQPNHRISNDAVGYQFDVCIKLPFERGLVWFVGRQPQVEHLSLDSESVIPIYNRAVTSTLFKIVCVSTNRGDIHLLKNITAKQTLFANKKQLTGEHILQHGDTLKVLSLPLEIHYRIIEKERDRTEDDTVSFSPTTNEQTEIS